MAREMADTEARDQDLAELIIETVVLYKNVDDSAPPRNYEPNPY